MPPVTDFVILSAARRQGQDNCTTIIMFNLKRGTLRRKLVAKLLFITALIGLAPTARAGGLDLWPELRVDNPVPGRFSVGDLPTLKLSHSTSLPVRHLLIQLQDGERAEMVRVEASTRATLSFDAPSSLPRFTPTSADDRYQEVQSSLADLIERPDNLLSTAGEIFIDGRRFAELMLFPVTIDSAGVARYNNDFVFHVADRKVSPSDVIDRETILAESASRPQTLLATGDPDASNYLIITSESMAESFDSFVQYKTKTGFTVSVVTVEQIVVARSGIDTQESIREYLRAFHDGGGKYVLLGGDESVVPVRYAYHLNAYSMPDLDQLQICDLYYADLTGDWDVDGDNVWGEPYHDKPDILPELIVGRLPVSTPAEVARYTQNLMTYESSPGSGNPEYLSEAFFFSADQLRDGNQHGIVAKALPDNIVVDSITGVESASGDDPSPTNTPAVDLKNLMSRGFGFVNILAHGRIDGFVVKSSGYYDWPKEFLLAEPQFGIHGSIDSLIDPARPSFYYSIACDNGAFDLVGQPGFEDEVNFSAHLLAVEGGAAGMIAHSRWGWVESSYELQKSFYDHLFADSARSAAEAMYLSKVDHYYFRDLVYGQNYLGDPSLVVYRGRPRQTTLAPIISGERLEIMVSADDSPVPSCRIILSDAGGVLLEGITDEQGRLTLHYPCDPQSLYYLAAVRPGITTSIVSFVGSLVTDVEDEERSLPSAFALEQNYPNPFNPSTTINFSLPESGPVRLELFNSLGQSVAVLADGNYGAGEHQITWHGTDNTGHSVGSGVYFYRLSDGASSCTRKMLLLK